jgi:hypothetical protein
VNSLTLTIVLSLFNPYIIITSQKFSSTPFHLLFVNLYSWPPCGSTLVLSGYLLLRHSCTWDKTSIFWLCQVFWRRCWKVSYYINYIFYFSFHFYLFSNFCFFFFSFSFYSCMRVWSRTLSGRLSRKFSSKNMAEEDNQSLHYENNRVKTLRDYMNPTKTSASSCIISLLMHLTSILSQKLFNFYLLFMA